MQKWGKREILEADWRYIAEAGCIAWEKLRDSHILVTGATGLIGTSLIGGLMAYNEYHNGNILVLAHARNEKKARELFREYIERNWLKLFVGDITESLTVNERVDYIIHGASITSSRAFVDKPVETILTAVEGSENLLELAREKQVRGMVYLSSMEVYGTPTDKEPLTEDKMGYINPLAVRSSYSESKRMVENLCAAYVSEYGVPVRIVRLTQTFGPGVELDDGRVFAEFARCAMRGEDIRLQTEGKSKRMYLYTADASVAVLTVLTRGKDAEAYNAANPETYCSIREMAKLVAEALGDSRCRVVVEIPDTPNTSYNPTMEIYMDISKLNELGWHAEKNLREMYERMTAGCLIDAAF